MFGLAVLFGCAVGFALGLTGGGGGVFAVPLLVYGLGVAPREASPRLHGPDVGVIVVSMEVTGPITGLPQP